MAFKTDLIDDKQQVLFIDPHAHRFLDLFKTQLKKYDSDVYVSPKIPHDISKFEILFIVDNGELIDKFSQYHHKKFVFIFTRKKLEAQQLTEFVTKYHKSNCKIVNVDHPQDLTPPEVESILWFVFGNNSELFLHVQNEKIKLTPKAAPKKVPRSLNFKYFIKPQRILISLAICILTLHLFFWVPLGIATFLHYRAARTLSSKNFSGTKFFNTQASGFLSAAKTLYSPVRPTYLLFALVVYPDNAIEFNDRSHRALQTSYRLLTQSASLSTFLFKKNKSPDEKQQMISVFNQATRDADTLEDDLSVIYQKFPAWTATLRRNREKLKNGIALLSTFKKFLPYLSEILGQEGEKKYLLLFANNMELRPGGGFIGSFAILTVKDLSINELKVYDVYDADGQLKVHVPPPKPIEKYLEQPHWFLRDSAFSPDFFENYTQALGFLQKEMNFTRFDGGAIITTTAIQNLLASMGNVYIPDFKEIVNKDNFYLKAQIYAEKDFFPGSLQKKRFLSAVLDQIIVNFDTVSLPQLLEMLQKSLNEKQIALYSPDTTLQTIVDGLYWSGRTIVPACAVSQTNCISDYVLPIDANLGVNKANFFVSRALSLDVRIGPDGSIVNHLKIQIKNDSPNDVFPGGRYKNYFQVYLPIRSNLKTITKNGTLVEEFDEYRTSFHVVGFLVEVKPQSVENIEIEYELTSLLQSGKGIYQLVVQKQIGAPNSDLNLQITLPKNIYIVNQNFTPLVKGHTILYNTNLSSDKIFFIDLIKE